MRWTGRRQSENVEDRRGIRPSRGMAVGGGVGGVILLLVVMLLGGDPKQLLNPGGGQQGPVAIDPAQDELKQFVSVVLADTEDVWRDQFRRHGETYKEPRLVLYSGEVESACGFATAAVGPFYCPGDQQVYVDLEFFSDLKTRFEAPGDFAVAYVLAHEVGHHVQNLRGDTDRVHGMRGRVNEAEFNRLSVRLELQADYLAGVWAHHAHRTKDILESGDIEEAMRAASAVGDDRLQRQSQGYSVPDSFKHGTSEQRARWFRAGLQSGDMTKGDTFNIPYGNL